MVIAIILDTTGFAVVALLSGYLAHHLGEVLRLRGIVSRIYLYFVSFLISVSAFGLLLFAWGLENVVYVISVFATAIVLIVAVPRLTSSNRVLRKGIRERVKEGLSGFRPSQILIIVSAIFLFGLGFLAYQNEVYPRGWDAGRHYIYVESLLVQGTLPTFELGTLASPYYQRGYHMSVAALVLLGNAEISEVFGFFNLVLLSTLPLAAWFFSQAILNSKWTSSFAALSALLLGSVIIVRGNYPMLMSFHFLVLGLGITLSFAMKQERVRWPMYVLLPVIGMEMMAIHPVMAEFYFLLGLGLLIFSFVSRRFANHLTSALLPIYTLVLGALLYFLLYPDFFSSQVSFALNRISNAPPTDAFIQTAIRSAVAEALILFFPLLLLPPFLIGILSSLRLKSLPILSLASVALTLTFMQLLPLNGREPFLLFLPITLFSSIGLAHIFRAHMRSKKRLSRFLLASFVAFVLLFSANHILYVASDPVFGRTSYLSDTEIEFAAILEGQNISGSRFATLINPAMIRVGILSGNIIVVGDQRFYTLKEFREIYFLIFEDECQSIQTVSAQYGIDGILLTTRWRRTPDILENYSQCFEEADVIEHSDIILLYWGIQ